MGDMQAERVTDLPVVKWEWRCVYCGWPCLPDVMTCYAHSDLPPREDFPVTRRLEGVTLFPGDDA